MFTLKDFETRYKNYSNSDLLDILDNPKNYQLIALEAARNELSSRNLSNSDINSARHTLKVKKEKSDAIAESNDRIKKKLINNTNQVVDVFNPIQQSIPTSSKLIYFVSFIYTLLLLYEIWNNWENYKYIISGEYNEQFAYTVNLFPVLLLATGVISFWFKKKPGWILLVVYSSLSSTLCIFSGYFSFSYYFGSRPSFFPYPSPTSYILVLLFYVGTILTLIRKDVLEVFSLKSSDRLGPIFVGVLIGILLIMLSS